MNYGLQHQFTIVYIQINQGLNKIRSPALGPDNQLQYIKKYKNLSLRQ